MLGAIIGDLAAWTWENDHEKFYPKLISDKAELSGYGRAVLNAASRNVLRGCTNDVSPIGTPLDGLKYFGQWLMWHVIGAWMDDKEYSCPKDVPQFYSVDKEEHYARLFTTKLIKCLRMGASKTETYNATNKFNGLPKHWDWKTADGDKSILSHVFRAWDCFYHSFDFTSAIHNAMRWSGDRHLVAALTGAFASAMYGCNTMMLKKKYSDEDYLERDLVRRTCTIVDTALHEDAGWQINQKSEEQRSFFPKNNARTNVEWHKYEPVCNPFKKVLLSEEDKNAIYKAFYTDWDNRYGFYLDDGWVYSYRSFVNHGRFRMQQESGGWRMVDLQTSGEMEYKMLLLAVSEALYCCHLSANEPLQQLLSIINP